MFQTLTNVEDYPKLLSKSLTLKWLNTPVKIGVGAEYDMEVSRFGIPQLISIRIEELRENEQVSFAQTVGFFKKWTLTVKLQEHSQDETRVQFLLNYELPMGIAGKLFDDIYFSKYLKSAFETVVNQL